MLTVSKCLLLLFVGIFTICEPLIARRINGKIAFSRIMKSGNIELFSMNSKGKNQIQLTFSDTFNSSSPIVNTHPSYSFDGKYLAFTSTRSGIANIFIMNSDGSNVKQVTDGVGSSEVPSFSPNGKKLTFTGNRNGSFEIFTINIDGSDLKQLTFNGAINDGPKYTPDGKNIIFSSDLNGTGTTRNRDIYMMNAQDGSNIRRITFGMDNRFSRSVSPNGKFVVFSSTKNNVGNIYIVKLNGSDLKQITHVTGNGSGFSPLPGWPVFNGAITPFWSPDGKYIAYADNSSGNYSIFKIRLDRSSNKHGIKRLTYEGNELSISWQSI